MAQKVETLAELEALYGAANPMSLVKELDHLSDPYRAFVEAAPFAIVSTMGPTGLDCSPRGDPAGFVAVEDAKTLSLPDRRGNNRIDTLRNLIADPRIGVIFLIPGVGETLRIKGRAEILRDAALCDRFAIDGKPPTTVLRIAIERVYFQCPKALARSRLWDPAARVDRASLPTAGAMLAAASKEDFDGAGYDAAYPDRMRQTIY